jgi:peroxiredoxin Q/BCP
MRHILCMSSLLSVLFFCGCGTHEVRVEPVRIEPVHVTLDINVKMQQGEIEDAAAQLSAVTGRRAPDFTLPDQDRKPVTLSALQGQWVVLYFYPKDDTPGCTLEAKDFTTLLPRFEQRKAVVLGISSDPPESHCDFIARHALALRLLSDTDHKVMERYGAYVRSSLGELQYGRTIRTTMIVDPRSVIRHYWPEVIAQGHAERVLGKLAALQDGDQP